MTVKKIFATDLDGTFLRPDHTYDRVRLRKILDQFRQKDYLFVAASGRSLLSLQAVFAGFEEDMAFLAENGSLVAYRDQMIFEDAAIAKEVYLPLIEQIMAGPYGKESQVLLSGKNGGFLLETVEPIYLARISDYYPNSKLVSHFAEVSEEIVKLVVTFPEEHLEEANQWLNQEFPSIHSVTTGFDSVDIILNGGNKAVGLQHLCTALDLTAQDVIAFGDNQNDIEMLEFAGFSFATSNAKVSIQALADQVIGSCEEDAVLDAIEAYLEQEK